MILLNGQSLAIKDRFPVETMPLNLEERNSNATITIGPDAPAIAINDWLKDDTEPGKGIIWRVKTVSDQKENGTRTIQLEHPIQILKDYVIFGEVKPGTMAGNNRADKCTARQAITYALSRQNIWQLGDLAENPQNPYTFNGDTVFAAIETVTGSLDGCQWEYDLGSLPFKLHIRKTPATFSSEMRMSRNITTLRKQIDRTRMYTRHYPIGKNNLHIDGDYLSKNENIWGVVCKVETDQSQDTKEKLRAWSQERLNRHCEPLVTVTVGGLEMSAETGEPLDHIVVGRKCRLPLPEYGTTILEKVTKISWADKIKDPKKITVTMANLVEDVASIVNSLAASTGRAGRAGAKKGEEDHAWFLDTSTHVGMIAEAVAGPGAAEDWSRVSEVIVDGQGIHQRVTRTEGEVVAAWAAIEVLDDKIDMEVANAKSDMFSHVEQTASHIRSEVNASKSTIFSTIMQTATNIYTQVGNAKSDTYSKIEQTASSVRSDIWAAKSTLFSSIMQTATNIYTQVGNAKSDTYSKIEQTASSVRSDIWAAKSTLFSSIMQTATNIYTQVGNAKSDTYSKIEQTASSVRSDIWAAKSTLFSSIMQTATNIYTQVGNAKSDTYSRIEQTASTIRTEVSTANSSVWSSIMQSATQITLKANKTYVDGQLEGLSAKFQSITVVEGSATYISSNKVYAPVALHIGTGVSGGSGSLYYRGEVYGKKFIKLMNASANIAEGAVLGTDSGTTLNLTHYHKIVAEEGAGADAGKIILTLTHPVATDDTTDHTTNFNIADTTTYKNGVASARNNVKVKAFTADARQGTLNDHRTFTYTTDAPTPASGTSQADTWYLTASTNWSSNKKTVNMRYGSDSGTSYAQLEVDASALVSAAQTAAKNSVGINDFTADARQGALNDHRTFTYTTDAPTPASKADTWYLVPSGLTVYLKYGSNSGNNYAQASCSDSNLVAGNIKSGVTIFGVTGSYSGSSVTPSSDIQIGSYTNTSSDPGSSYVEASTMASTIKAAHNLGNWFGFKVTINGVSGAKYYKCHLN